MNRGLLRYLLEGGGGGGWWLGKGRGAPTLPFVLERIRQRVSASTDIGQPQISVLSSFTSLRLHRGVSDQGSPPINSSGSGTKTGGHWGGECSGGSALEGERLPELRAIY